MKQNIQTPSAKSTIHSELWALGDLARGKCTAGEIAYCQTLLLCFAKKSLFDNGRYNPDLSDNDTYFYYSIWNILEPVWKKFETACGEDLVREAIKRIQRMSEKISLIDRVAVFQQCIDNIQQLGYEIFAQPSTITELGVRLLNYQGGSVYNPFAGTASFGARLKIGDKYYGDEINPETWALGALRLLVGKNASHNFIQGDSAVKFGLSSDISPDERFNYIISTPPFNCKISNSQITAEELLLSKAELQLEPNGTMVIFASAQIANSGGKFLELRRRISERNLLDSVIALPKGAFQPNTTIPTVVITLKKDRGENAVKFLDARECFDNKKKLNVNDIIARLNDPNYFYEASYEQIVEKGYSWHPAKYEDSVEEKMTPGSQRLMLKDLLIQTGSSANDFGKLNCLSISDLSSNPFDFKFDIDNLPKKIVEGFDHETKILEQEYSNQLKDLLTRKESLSLIRNDLEVRIKEEKLLLSDEISKINDRRRHVEQSMADLSRQIFELEKKIDIAIQEHNRTLENTANGLNHALVFEQQNTISALQKEKARLTEQLVMQRETEDMELREKSHIKESKRASIQAEYERVQEELHMLSTQIVQATSRLNSIQLSIKEGSARKMIKVVHPCLILGGSKPSLKFAFVDASAKVPVYLGSNHCYAFKIDTSIVDVDYLVYQIKNIEFKEFGETIPMITREEILNTSIVVIPLDEQRKFMLEKEEQAFPYKAEIRYLNNQIMNRDEVLSSKHHELGHYRYRLFNCSSLLYELISNMPSSTPELPEALRLLDVIDENLIDMQDSIESLEDKEMYPVGNPIDIFEYFNTYCSEHTGGINYKLSFSADKLSYDQLSSNFLVRVDEGVLRRIINNIRSNAEKHGFADDDERTDYHINILLRIDVESDICIIDFVNNGAPFAEGFSEAEYADPSGKAEPHPGTGKGGAEVAKAMLTYGGSFKINPEDGDPDKTTIRLIFPLYHD